MIVGRGELEILKEALPRQLEELLDMIERFIVHKTLQAEPEK